MLHICTNKICCVLHFRSGVRGALLPALIQGHRWGGCPSRQFWEPRVSFQRDLSILPARRKKKHCYCFRVVKGRAWNRWHSGNALPPPPAPPILAPRRGSRGAKWRRYVTCRCFGGAGAAPAHWGCALCQGRARVGPSPPSAPRPAAWAGRWAGCELRGCSATLPVRGAAWGGGELRGGEGGRGDPDWEGKEVGVRSGLRPGLLRTLGARRQLALTAGRGVQASALCPPGAVGSAWLELQACGRKLFKELWGSGCVTE